MSDKTDNVTKIKANVDKPLDDKQVTPAKEAKVREPLSKFNVITLVLAVVGVCMSISGLIKIQTWGRGFQALRAELSVRLDAEQTHLDKLEQSLKAIGNRQQAFDTQLTYYRSVIIPALQEKRPTDFIWQMQKVSQWLKQAQLDLHWSEDRKGALLLLKAAQGVLAQSNVPQIAPFKAQISQAITAVSAIPPLHCTHVLLQLHTIVDSIPNLPAPVVSAQVVTSASASAEPMSWSQKAFASLKRLVTIRPSSEVNTDTLVLQKQARQEWNTNMALYLQQAQWALLQKDDKLFHWSVDQATQALMNNNGIIDLTDGQAMQCVETLKELLQLNLHPTVPNLAPLCRSFNAYIKTLTVTPEKAQ